MFSKLLKYDLRAIFKYWWIAAVTSVALSLVGGVCLNIVSNDKSWESEIPITVFAAFGLFIVVIGISIFGVLTEVLTLIRFYKHFFTDEGYLTFTLPVKKSSLLNSKIFSSLIISLITGMIIILEFFVIVSIGMAEEVYTKQTLKDITELITLFTEDGLFYNILILLLIFAIIIAAALIGIMFAYICITFAAVIAKKHKVLAAIGIYYAANSAVSFVTQILAFTNIAPRVIVLISNLPEPKIQIASSVALLGVVALLGIIFGGMYLLENYLLDRKLNLE